MAKEPWQEDGKRYVTSLQDTVDLSCYKDFFECDTFKQAQEKADEAAEKHQRNALVFDRKEHGTVYKKVIESKDKPEVKVPPPKIKRGRKKSEKPTESKKEVSAKDSYFE